MIFSPDLAPLIGPYPGKANYWTACGVMTGFSQSAAIGMVTAAWMSEGEPPMDVFMWDVARFGRWAGKDYVKARTADMYATRFKTLYPYEERPAGRPVMTTPAYASYREMGAVFGASDGLEYPLWFAPQGVEPKDSLTFRRPNWWPHVAAECKALSAGVGLIDISTYGKHIVRGPKARAWLDNLMANKMPIRDGQMVLTPMLSPKGQLVGEFSVAQLAGDEFLLVGSGSADRYHHRLWEAHLPADGVTVESMTTKLCGFSVSGPNARKLLEKLCDTDMSAEAWKYGRVGRVQIGPAADAILSRVSYTGELGYEVLVPFNAHLPLLEALLNAGGELGAKLAGIRALNALRIEKGYGAWGLEYAPDYTPFEAGMGRLIKFDKGDFVGRDAALAARDLAPRFIYRQFNIETTDAEPWGGEPIMRDGQVVGYLTSAAFGHRVGHCVALGYLQRKEAENTEGLYVDILGDRRAVVVRDAAAFDPEGKRMRG